MSIRKSNIATNPEVLNPRRISQCSAIAQRGVSNTHDLGNLMRALVSDLDSDAVSPQKANAMANCCKTMLKCSEVEFKWKTSDGYKGKSLQLATGK